VVIVDCPDGSVISHTFEQVKTAINDNKVVYASAYGTIKMSLAYVADDDSFIEFHSGYSTDQIYSLKINNDNTFTFETIKKFASEDYVQQSLQNFKYEAVLTAPQSLTEAQKAQARANLGISENVNPGPSEVITNYDYTYNGDTSDESYNWVLNGSGHKMFAKLGELPEGTMNIIGSEITVTNHTNSSLTVHFTVTEEHLTRELSMYDGAMVAQATQTGFT
jgi:hypothetical protein